MSSHCSAPAAFEHMGSCRPPAKAQLEAADAVLRRVAAPPAARLGQPAPGLPGKAAVRQARHDGSSAHAAALRWQHPQHRSPPQPHVQATSDVCLAALRPTLPSGVPCTAPEAQHGEQAPCSWSSFGNAHWQLQQHMNNTQHQTEGRLAAAAGTHSASLQDSTSF